MRGAVFYAFKAREKGAAGCNFTFSLGCVILRNKMLFDENARGIGCGEGEKKEAKARPVPQVVVCADAIEKLPDALKPIERRMRMRR